jgi:glutaredoxin-related protein
MPDRPRHSDAAAAKSARFHADTVAQVADAVANHEVVVVGMGWNPHVRRARRALEAAGVPHTYLGFGNYLTGWKHRLAIKLWAGWPTFPQVFVRGELIGGANETERAIESGDLANKLSAASA